MSTSSRALNVLQYNQIGMERLLMELMAQPTRVLKDEEGDTWTFTARKWCGLFLMAKTTGMKKYEVVHAIPK